MIEVWFEPHATTADNEAKIASGWNDVDLSELGVRQANELVERCRDRSLDAIFCSDLQRAVKTAVPAADGLHLPVYVDRRLRECDYGDMTQQPSSLIDQQRPARILTPFPNGESYKQAVLERMAGFYVDLKRELDGKTILMIGHRATQYGLEVFGLGKSLDQCMAEPTEYWTGAYDKGRKYEII